MAGAVEGKGIDVATLANLRSRVNLLGQTILPTCACGQSDRADSTLADLHNGLGGGCKLDVIHEEAVAIGVYAAVLGVGPFERMGAGGDVERIGVPAGEVCTVGELCCFVNVENALVIEGAGSLALAQGIERDVAAIGEGVCGFNGGSGGGHPCVAAHHTPGTAVAG